jgi:hypothetical protein
MLMVNHYYLAIITIILFLRCMRASLASSLIFRRFRWFGGTLAALDSAMPEAPFCMSVSSASLDFPARRVNHYFRFANIVVTFIVRLFCAL